MRSVSFMLISVVLVFLLAGCNDSSKIDELTKANAALAAELQECRASQKKTALQEEEIRKTKENLKKYENLKIDGPKF